MVRKIALIVLIAVVSMSTVVVAQETQADQNAKKHAIVLNPLNLIGGGLSGSYEYICNEKTGILIDGCSNFDDSYSVQVAYLRHNEKNGKGGHWSPFWGPFVRYRAANISFEHEKVDYSLDFESLNVGLMMGKGYRWGDSWKFGWRLGYGVPVYTDYDWGAVVHDDHDLYENWTTVLGGLEVGVSIGYVF